MERNSMIFIVSIAFRLPLASIYLVFLTHYFENFLCKHLVTIHQQMVSNKHRMKPGAVSWLLWRGIGEGWVMSCFSL